MQAQQFIFIILNALCSSYMVEHFAVLNTSEPQWSPRDKESNLANQILLFIQIHIGNTDSNSP